MASMGLIALFVAWVVAWPVAVLILGLPGPLSILAWAGGMLAAGWLAWRTLDPSRRTDAVSRVEARRLARDRFEEDRLRRLREERGPALERRERDAEARIDARMRELLEHRAQARRPETAADEREDALST